MRYRRWSFGLSLTVDSDVCSVCGTGRASDGRHDTLEYCNEFGGKPCTAPDQHHPFARRIIPFRVKREVVW